MIKTLVINHGGFVINAIRENYQVPGGQKMRETQAEEFKVKHDTSLRVNRCLPKDLQDKKSLICEL